MRNAPPPPGSNSRVTRQITFRAVPVQAPACKCQWLAYAGGQSGTCGSRLRTARRGSGEGLSRGGHRMAYGAVQHSNTRWNNREVQARMRIAYLIGTLGTGIIIAIALILSNAGW